jgi:hypothetical protein
VVTALIPLARMLMPETEAGEPALAAASVLKKMKS